MEPQEVAWAVNRDGSILDYCRLKDITIQPWSPFQYGFFEGVFLDNPKFPQLNAKVDEIAQKYGVTGTMNPEHLKDCAKASDIRLTREEWYAIYQSAGNILP